MLPIIDADWIRYGAGFAAEKRSIKAIHTQTGDEYSFKNRTEFYGKKKSKDGGWLEEINKTRDTPLLWTEFDILDVQTPEPIDHVLFTVKRMFDSVLNRFDADKYYAFYGEGDSFRVERSSVIKYKGNREGTIRPMQIDDITEYMVRKYKMSKCVELEADDWCIIEGMRNKDSVVVSHDKDARGCAVNVWNPTKPDEPIINGRGFGDIYLVANTKGQKSVKGNGRKFFYFQVCYGDDVDNYRANSASELDWGEISAFNALDSAKTDKEAIQALVKVFKYLYPCPRAIIGWRGDSIVVDWKYMMQEQWDMAHMWRNPDNDWVNLDNVFDKLGIEI